jgi:TolA-binding protein
MNRFHAPFLAARLGLAGALLLAAAPQLVHAQQPGGLDQQKMAEAEKEAEAGNFQAAADAYASIEKDFPTSPFIPQASLQLGYAYFRLNDYDKAAAQLQKAVALKNIPPEGKELAMSLVPQVLSAKAGSMPADAPARKAAFEEAVKQYDVFLTSFPRSAEFETANYGKAVALYQLARYEDSVTALRYNIKTYPQSDAALDNRYLLALTLGTLANVSAQKAAGSEADVAKNYQESETLLYQIAAGQDVALANDAKMQMGELLFVRASLTKAADAQKPLYQRAMDAYRAVLGKDFVIQRQKDKIQSYIQRKAELIKTVATNRENYDFAMKRMPRLIQREQEKLAAIEQRPDQTMAARLKTAQIFVQLDRNDEARIVLNYAKPLVEDADQKKELIFYTALSLAKQNLAQGGKVKELADRTEAAYKEFKEAHKGDPIGESLAVVVGSGFVRANPEKAISYFKESSEDYPQGRGRLVALSQQAAALVALEKYDEALKAFQETLDQKPERDIAASAALGIASVYQKTGKINEAIAAYQTVRDEYKGSEPAEEASFWHAQLLEESGKSKEAEAELIAFTKEFPKSTQMPNALFYLGSAQAKQNKNEDALKTYKRIAEEFPQAQVAPYSYLRRGDIHTAAQRFDDTVKVMQELIKAYPDSEQLFLAYDQIANIYNFQQKYDQQIETYEELVKNKPDNAHAADALGRIASLWKDQANRIGRYAILTDEKKDAWKKATDASADAVERLLAKYPESEVVALGLKTLLEVQTLRRNAKLLESDEDVKKYFQALADKAGNPGTKSKILFTLAAYSFGKDKAAAEKTMASAYDPAQKYAPQDLDLYGMSLIEQKKYEPALAVYDKLAKDYPIPDSVQGNPSREIQEAQAMVLFGRGKVLQEQGKSEDAGKLFAELEKKYAWSPKNLEGSYGIAAAQHQEKKYDDALKRLVVITKASTATAELRAKSMLLLARCLEDSGRPNDAIDNYIRVEALYEGVPAVASEALWRGATLMEKQSKGEIAMPTPPPKAAPKAAAKAAAPAAKK